MKLLEFTWTKAIVIVLLGTFLFGIFGGIGAGISMAGIYIYQKNRRAELNGGSTTDSGNN